MTTHPLPGHGFESIETELPGGWWTDGDRSICVLTRWRPHADRRHYRVLVFDVPAAEVSLSAPRLATATHTSQAVAVREALTEVQVLTGGG
jgi:hypothetical protein